jgi:ABC-type sugar transport system ATPase subunit
MPPQDPFVVIDSISKRFAGTQALDNVSFTLGQGEVHALIGENGAGKSTLIKILGGVHVPDTGTITMAGERVSFATPKAALASGIVVIPQEMRIVPALSVAENVMMGHLPTTRALGVLPALDRSALKTRSRDLLRRLNVEVDPDLPAGQLPFAERQLVMIARALGHEARILVLDEPTAALEAREVERLFDVVSTLKEAGVGIIYVSHRLDEVERLADRCTILRDGRVVEVFERGQLGTEDMIRLMTGRDLEELHRAHDRSFGELMVEFDHDAGTDTDGEIRVRAREVVGLAGLLGSGTTETLRRMFGAGSEAASIRLRGEDVALHSPAQAIRQGLGLVPDERAHGLIMALTVRENIVLPNLDRLSTMRGLDRAACDELADELMEAVDIRPRDPERPVRELSGGNQQKVIFARWLAGHADVLLLDEPTHGIDVGAKAQIHRLMRHFVEDGGGIVFSSSEMIEVMSISDSVIALRHGEIVARMSRDGEFTERALRTALGG